MNQKGFAPLIIVIVLAVILGVGYYFYLKQNNTTPMEMKPEAELCDLNEDRKCNVADHVIFNQALGKKVRDVGYNLSADVDANGVVDVIDEQILFPVTRPKASTQP